MRAPLALAVGAVLGAAALGAVRFAAVPADAAVHHHANWLVMVDGARLDLSGMRYMEDVAACSALGVQVAPEQRVHMHDRNADAVHVHALGATWGHLLANIGFALTATHLVTDSGRVYATDSARTLKFVVNGRAVDAVHNRLILSGDRLLISYGPETVDEAIGTQFPRVASTAEQLDTQPDPASCSGPVPLTVGERLRRAFWF